MFCPFRSRLAEDRRHGCLWLCVEPLYNSPKLLVLYYIGRSIVNGVFEKVKKVAKRIIFDQLKRFWQVFGIQKSPSARHLREIGNGKRDRGRGNLAPLLVIHFADCLTVGGGGHAESQRSWVVLGTSRQWEDALSALRQTFA